MSRHSRYERYSGGADPLEPPVDLRDALEAIGDDVLEGTSPRQALRELLRRGMANRRGLDDLAAEANRRRRELLARNNLGGTLQEVAELLEKALLAERKELARALDDDARFAEMRLESRSPRAAEAVRELADYDWRSPEARADYEKIKDLIGREALDQRFAGMKQALENAGDEDRERARAMIADLNGLLAKHARGEDSREDFSAFMAEHGRYFPENPGSVEELIDSLARRAAAGARLRNSLTPEQRAELDSLASQAFGDPGLIQELSRLDELLQQARPGEDWNGGQEFDGERGLGLGDGTTALADIADLESLAEALSQSYPGASLDDIDLDALTRQLGDRAAVDARALAALEKALRENFLHRADDGSWQLTPQAMRQLGRAALRDAATRLSGRRGERDTRRAGAAGEPTGSSREWQFGDTEPWDVTRTVTNAVLRTAASAPRDPGTTTAAPGARGSRRPIRLGLGDVEILETETRTQAAVALLVDTSFSMVMEGRWGAMKRTGLALHHLVSTRFRGDELQLIGFGLHAQALDVAELAGLEGAYEQGTNLHHALLLALRHFRRHPSAQPVVLIVTDGEPTAHLEPDGEAVFDYPPSARTLASTVRELDALARMKAQVTFFRLGEDPSLARFVDQIARRIGGRVVAPDIDGLGAAVVGDYLSSRRRPPR